MKAVSKDRSETFRALWPAPLLVGVYMLVEPFLRRAGDIPFTEYVDSRVILWALLKSPYFVICLLLGVVSVIRRPSLTWSKLPFPERSLRWLPWLLGGVFCWYLFTASYNYEIGRYLWIDRWILLAVAVCAWRHPALLLVLVSYVLALLNQYGGSLIYSWTDKNLVCQVLILLGCWTIIEVWKPGLIRLQGVLTAILALIGAWYLLPAIGKLQIGWLGENRLENLVHAAHWQNGWSAFLSPGQFEWVIQAVAFLRFPLQLFALVAELSVLFFMLRRTLSTIPLVLCAVLHAGIFLSSGIFFWKWIILDLTLAVLIWRIPVEYRRDVFNTRNWTVCLVLMSVLALAGPRLVKLAWYDSPLVHHFHIVGKGESGNLYQLTPAVLAPHDLAYAQARFYFLTRHPAMIDTFGSVRSLSLNRKLNQARDWADLEPIRQERGWGQYSKAGVESFSNHLRNFLNWTRHRNHGTEKLLDIIQAPGHIWSASYPDSKLPVYSFEEPLESIDVFLFERFFDGSESHVVHEEKVLTVTSE